MTKLFSLLIPSALILSAMISFSSCSNKTEKVEETPTQEEITSELKEDLRDGIPVVIDFYATWCIPCKEIAPEFDSLKMKYSDKLNFLSVDVDEQKEIAEQFNITAVPTFVFLDADENEIDRIVGADTGKLRRLISQIAAIEKN